MSFIYPTSLHCIELTSRRIESCLLFLLRRRMDCFLRSRLASDSRPANVHVQIMMPLTFWDKVNTTWDAVTFKYC